MLKNILKLFLIALILIGLVVLIAWLVMIRGYPWWVGLSLVVGLFSLWIGFLYTKKFLLRRREKIFVSRVIEQDDEAIAAAPTQEMRNLKELQDKWKESVDLLRNSHLRKKGNPLYVLPWYLILGESGSGKTSAIKNSNLNSPITEVKRTVEISVTRNCDWWFFEEAIILDTAGRYTIPVGEGIDKAEWEKFLTLLAKYRRREPINGVIVTIAADKLLEQNEAKLSDEGQSVRRRIDQLMKILGAKIPVYILVTKMDLIHGMVEFSNLLSPKAVDQAMGYVNEDSGPYSEKVLNNAMSSISKNLRILSLIMVHQGYLPEPEIFLFPSGFERLRSGLHYFIQGVFEKNPYQETPLFRGLFFSSAIQEGKLRPDSEIFGISSGNESLVQNNGLFLKDFFKTILTHDRHIFTPLPEFIAWHRITRNLGLLSWLSLWLCLCGLMSFSFLNNRSALKVVSSYKPPVMTSMISNDLLSLTTMRSKIQELEKANRRWLLPKVGFRESYEVEVKLKIHFLQVFRDDIIYPFDREIIKKIDTVGKTADPDELMNYYEFLQARITLLKERVEGKKRFSIEQYTDISNRILLENNKNILPEVASMFGNGYLYYLTWNENTKEFKEQYVKFQDLLVKFLKKDENLRSIIFESISGSPDIHLTDFWESLKTDNNYEQIFIPGIYTNDYQKKIESYFNVLESSIIDHTFLKDEEKKFWEWYQEHFYEAWSTFSHSFQKNLTDMDKGANLHHLATLMTTDQNPYFLLFSRMADELAGVQKINKEPNWVSFIQKLDNVREQAKVEEEKEQGTLLGKLESKKESIIQTTLGKVDRQMAVESELLKRLGTVWGEYTEALEKISTSLGSRENCFRILSEFNMSPFALAESKYTQLRNLLEDSGDFPFIWDMVIGPERFLVDYCARETTFILQEQWEEQVLGGIAGAKSENVPPLLFDKTDGLIWQYIETTGKAFITRSSYGYHTRRQFEKLIPFKNQFFTFLDNGMESVVNYQPMYYVTIETLPLDVNDSAKVKPFGSIISLQCSEQKLVLNNYNYPQKQTFDWSGENCGDVTLSILFPEFTLTKMYEGKMGFPNFLTEFRDGSHTFKSDEFPGHVDDLKKMSVSWIKLSYKISGSLPVIQLLGKSVLRVPEEIVSI